MTIPHALLSDLNARYADRQIVDLMQLRKALQSSEMRDWSQLFDQTHPVVKAKAMYKLRDKYDKILTQHLTWAKAEYYFDDMCHRHLNMHKFDTTFLALFHQLMMLGHEARFTEKEQLDFRNAFIREFTLRDYVFPVTPFLRRKPEAGIMHLLQHCNSFIDWHVRMTVINTKKTTKPAAVDTFFLGIRQNLMALLYDEHKKLNPNAHLHLFSMALEHPGKLMTFLL